MLSEDISKKFIAPGEGWQVNQEQDYNLHLCVLAEAGGEACSCAAGGGGCQQGARLPQLSHRGWGTGTLPCAEIDSIST